MIADDEVYQALLSVADEIDVSAENLLTKGENAYTDIIAGAMQGAAKIVRMRAHARLIELATK